MARYVRSDDAGSAEVAVTVVDDWQGRGAGTALLERLVERARENGIERFVALVLQENDDAHRALPQHRRRRRPPASAPDGHLELVIELPRDGVTGRRSGRALRSAASGRVEIHPWRLIKERLQAVRATAARAGRSPEE